MWAPDSRARRHQPLDGSARDPIKSVFDQAETPMMIQAPQRPRTVGLDKPCRKCGAPIHHTYAGPVEGVCGRCTDKRRRRRVRTRRLGMSVTSHAPSRRSTASTVVLVSIVMVVGAVAVAFALSRLLG